MIQNLIQYINQLSGGNQFLAAAISAWLLGVITFTCKNIPKRIAELLKKHMTTSFMVTSHNESYYCIMAWFLNKGYSGKLRRINLTNGRYGNNNVLKSIGLGSHIIWHNWIPMYINLSEKDSSAVEADKFVLTITIIGRSHKFFDHLLENIQKSSNANPDKTKVYVYSKDYWSHTSTQPKRLMNTIFIPKSDKRFLIETLTKFREKEQWYIDHGIPYHLGILLHGPPGTGKTSLIKAIAAELDYEIRILSPEEISNIVEATVDLSKEANPLVVIEDVDSSVSVKKRKDKQLKEFNKHDSDLDIVDLLNLGVSNVLNAMDGIVSAHGRVMVMTTNHVDKLDAAFLRPGRIDFQLEVGYAIPEVFCEFIKQFFGAELDETSIKLLRDNLTIAELQQKVLEGKDLEYFLNTYTCKLSENINSFN